MLSQAKKDWASLEDAWPEDDFEVLQQRATQEWLGLAEPPQRRHHPRRVAVRDGFSLHADTAVHGHDRQGLERLCRSGARGAVAKVSAPAPRRWPVRVFAEEGHHLHRHRGSAGASARRAPPSKSAFTSPRSTAPTPPTPACAPSSPNRLHLRNQPRCPARHRRRWLQPLRNQSGPASTGPSFTSAPSAPTCCVAPVVEGAPSGASIPPANTPKPASPSSASPCPRRCCRQPPRRRSCRSRCEAYFSLLADFAVALPVCPQHSCAHSPRQKTATPTLVLPTSAPPTRASVTRFGSRFPGFFLLFFQPCGTAAGRRQREIIFLNLGPHPRRRNVSGGQ